MAVDAHIHLDSYPPDRREQLLNRAFASGVEGLVAVSMGFRSFAVVREWAARFPGRILPAYGHHPEQPPLAEEELARMRDWIGQLGDGAFAIGEVGLPYYLRTEAETSGRSFDEAPYIVQLEAFVRLAAELDRPIALHAVYEDADKALELLERHRVRRAHFHWFKGGPETINRIVARRYMISIAPDVLYEPEIRELAARVPLAQLMTETDGPWPFEGPFAGKETVPEMVLDVVREIASLRGSDEAETAAVLRANARRFYGIG
ncbi:MULTISPECIES: TatD family hydrolase [Cohnella]|uniref:TatD family hydrolase n=1 Tax=Cohnella TaxID=329857 RepID=UPI0009B97456|nr:MULTISPECIES: TatD family hydrolase [Cohnella]MBN2983514.1 TatD family hydrolase [Cohnella algarum]